MEIYDKTLEEALLCITKTIDKVMTGEIAFEDLIISKQLRMNIHNYRSIFPHVADPMQLSNNERASRGDNIEYLYTDSQHQNPLSRVVPAQFIRNNDDLDYDREKYKEMQLKQLNLQQLVISFGKCMIIFMSINKHLMTII